MRFLSRWPLLTLDRPEDFPEISSASENPNGLLAIGGDLSTARICAAYRRGIFPWFSDDDPIMWWSPDPRMVLRPSDFRAQRSLKQSVRRNGWRISIDTAFLAVIHACASTPREGQHGTWIVAAMLNAYCRLHREGLAHSVEVWEGDTLIGGLYGLSIGRMFFGESMFSHRSDASKAALWHLCQTLADANWQLIDCQMQTQHLTSLGAHTIPRTEFLARVQELSAGLARDALWQRVAG